jgi:galactokinase
MIDISAFIDDFRSRFRAEPRLFAAPGRVNLIGEHTDYNDGFVLPFALEERTYIACSHRDDGQVNAFTRTLDKTFEMRLGAAASSNESWAIYVRGMAEILDRHTPVFRGANVLIDSEIPFGAGLSSSAALEVALGLGLSSMAGPGSSLKEIAFWGQRVEHEFIGVRSGIMDQLASALSRENHLTLIDCRSLETTYVPFDPPDMVLAICDTKVKHNLAATEYNRRREECEAGMKILEEFVPAARSLRDISVPEFTKLADNLPEPIRRRCRHVVTENERVLNAVTAIEHSEFARLGRLMYESHESLRDDYQVSCPELDLLVDAARKFPGVIGARMTGGGFGGCTINLMDAGVFSQFVDQMQSRYRSAFDANPGITAVRPSQGAVEIDIGSVDLK